MIGHTVIQRTLWCWALLLTLAIGACAASLTGQAQENGGTWELSWTLRSEKSIPRNTNLIAPDFEGFRVLAGPSISTSVNLINGRSSNERTWTYVLMPLKAGDVSVSPARVQYDGTTLSSRPLKIRAAAPGQSAGSGSRKIFLRAELSDTEAVVGQELVLNWVLYFNSNVNSYEPPRIDRLPGFLVQELEPVRQPEIEQRDLDGQTWNSAVIGRCLLYPTRSGELTLEPATATVSVPAQKARRSRDPFGSLFDSPVFDRNERLNLASDVVTLKVSDLPPGAPAGFSGAVGVYRMQAEPDRNSLAAGEALTMTVTLSGRGNVGMLQAPELVLSPDFERYDTQTEESLRPGETGMRGQRKFKTLLVPRAAGEQRIEAVRFVYYDTDKGQYKVLSQGPWSIQVSAGKSSAGGALVVGAAERVRSYGQDIRHLLAAPERFEELGTPLSARWWWRLLILMLLAAPLGSHLWAQRLQEKRRNLPGERRRLALSQARRRMKELTGKEADTQAGLVEAILLQYLADKQNLSAAGLVLGEQVEQLVTRGLSESATRALRELVRRLELIRYGGGQPEVLQQELTALLPMLEEAFHALEQESTSRGGAR